MNYWKKWRILPDFTILKVLGIIDDSAWQMGIITNENDKLLGIVTDGDIRRALLQGAELSAPISKVMNITPMTAKINDSKETILNLMRDKTLAQIPVVDEDNHVIHVEFLNTLIKTERKENFVVLMAGGLGIRLRPLTEDCPKPMLPVGNKPILETILESFIKYGFYKFFIAVNYKADIIKNYFGDGSKFGIEISYIEENKRLGTAGALSLLPQAPKNPIIIMNGDIITNVNFTHLLEYHKARGADAVVCVREYDMQVPYGVVQADKQNFLGIVEKPIHNFLVGAGIYVLNPNVLKLIPKDTFVDMPNLFNDLKEKNYKSSIFPINDYWIDIGRQADYENANKEF